MDHMTTCNVKGLARNDESTENSHLTLQFPSALQNIVVSFSSLFWFSGLQLSCVGSLSWPPLAVTTILVKNALKTLTLPAQH